MKRHNDDGMPKQNDVQPMSRGGEHSELAIHHSFPARKEPLDVNDHEHDHNPTTPHEGGTPLSTEHHGMSPANKTFYHLNKGQYKGTTVTNKTTYHG